MRKNLNRLILLITVVIMMFAFTVSVNAANAAKIGDTEYASLERAIASASNGDTVTLLNDITLTDRLFVNAGASPAYAGKNNRYATTTDDKSLTLDLNGKNITSSSNIALAGGSLKITGAGTISTTTSGLAPVEIYGTGNLDNKRTLTIGEDVVLDGTAGGYGLNVFGSNDATKNLIDIIVNGTVKETLFVLGNLKNEENEINIVVNGSVIATPTTGEGTNVGIALNGNAKVTVNDGAVVKGDSGIEVRAGELTVNGGNIEALADNYSYKMNPNGCTTRGAAIAVAQHTTKLATTATLNGGTLTGVKQIGITDVNNNMEDVKVVATEAFRQNSAVPEDYHWVETTTGSGKYILEERPDAVSIGTTGYKTLAKAFAAANDGATIKLLNNVTLTDRLFVNAGASPAYAGKNNRYATTTDDKSLTLDLNGKNITSSSNIALAGGSLKITGAGTISTTTSGLAPVEIYGTGNLDNKRTLTIGEDVVLDGTKGGYGLNVFGSNNEKKNLIDVTVNGTVKETLFVIGNLKNADNEINIVVNGSVIATPTTGEGTNVGIALNGNAKVTVNDGAVVKGDSGIEVRAGELTVNGGTIEALATTYNYKENKSGCTTRGAAIAVAQHHTKLATTATLNGGILTGVKKIGITDVNGDMSGVEVVATQAYTENSEIPEHCKWEEQANQTYKIVSKGIDDYKLEGALEGAKKFAKRQLGNIDKNLYSGDERKAVEKAISDAEAAIDSAASEDAVYAALVNANVAVAAQKTDAQKKADEKALAIAAAADAIDKATDLDESAYTADSFNAVDSALTALEALIKDKSADSAAINAGVAALKEAINKLQVKQAQTMEVSAKNKSFKATKLKKKKAIFKAVTVKNEQGSVTYTVKGNKKSTKALKFNKKNGKITVKKGTKKGKYVLNITVNAAGNDLHEAGTKTVKVTVKVK